MSTPASSAWAALLALPSSNIDAINSAVDAATLPKADLAAALISSLADGSLPAAQRGSAAGALSYLFRDTALSAGRVTPSLIDAIIATAEADATTRVACYKAVNNSVMPHDAAHALVVPFIPRLAALLRSPGSDDWAATLGLARFLHRLVGVDAGVRHALATRLDHLQPLLGAMGARAAEAAPATSAAASGVASARLEALTEMCKAAYALLTDAACPLAGDDGDEEAAAASAPAAAGASAGAASTAATGGAGTAAGAASGALAPATGGVPAEVAEAAASLARLVSEALALAAGADVLGHSAAAPAATPAAAAATASSSLSAPLPVADAPRALLVAQAANVLFLASPAVHAALPTGSHAHVAALLGDRLDAFASASDGFMVRDKAPRLQLVVAATAARRLVDACPLAAGPLIRGVLWAGRTSTSGDRDGGAASAVAAAGAATAASAGAASLAAGGAASADEGVPLADASPRMVAALQTLHDDVKLAVEEAVWAACGRQMEPVLEAVGLALAAGLLQRKGLLDLSKAAIHA